jgi:hypothetical protein
MNGGHLRRFAVAALFVACTTTRSSSERADGDAGSGSPNDPLCNGSACEAATPAPPRDPCADAAPDVDTCVALVASVRDAVAHASGDAGCTDDIDCVEISAAASCAPSCSGLVTSADAAPAVNAAIADANASACVTFFAAQCACTNVGALPPCPPERGAVGCVGGRCGRR